MTENDPLKKLYGKSFTPGQPIFREGEPGSKFYLIQAGKVRIVKGWNTPGEVVLGELGPGEFFGEMALFDLETRSATALAHVLTEVYELGQRNFENFVMHKPRVAYEIIQKLCQRLRRTGDTLATFTARKTGSESAGVPNTSLLLLLIQAGQTGQSSGGQVTVRPRVDLEHLSRLYGMDLSPLEGALAPLLSTRPSREFLENHPDLDPTQEGLARQIVEKTLVGVEIASSRK